MEEEYENLTAPSMQVVVTDPRVMNADGTMNQLLKGTEDSAGYDLVAWPEKLVTLYPRQPAVLIPLGIKLHIANRDLAGIVYPRSGLGHKKGLVLGNGTGVIDADYQGDMFVSAWNRSEEAIDIVPGDRIAQLVFQYVYHPAFDVVSDFPHVTERGAGGFGSTGISIPAEIIPEPPVTGMPRN